MFRTLIPIAILSVALPAGAQDTNTFRARVGAGAVSGTEQYTILQTPNGYELSSQITMKRGGSDARLTLRESLTKEWVPEKYLVEMTGAMGVASVSAERKGDVLAFSVKTPSGSPTKEIPLKAPLLLMENMVAAPYQILLNATRGKPASVAVVVPFQLASLNATLADGGVAQGTLDGKAVTASKLLFTLGGVQMEVLFEAATNRLLRVYVPAQDAELTREGFVPAATANAPVAQASVPQGVVEREVSFKSGDAQAFPALLCTPKASSRAPLVVLVQGSGPQDRDETIGPNKPFRDLAWGLAERGIASLRFDKRTRAFPTTYKGTLESESIDDAVAAVEFAGTLAEVDKDRIFVLGHSLGGLAAPYVAQRTSVRGLVLMAAPGRNMELVIRQQVQALNASLPADKLKEVLSLQDSIMGKVRAGTATAQDLNGVPPAPVRDMIVRDPIAELKKTKVPILVLKGGKDAQVFQEDFDALAAIAASRSGSKSRLFPNLTHIFTPSDGPARVQAIFEPGRVAQDVIETIASWITETGRT